MAGGGGGAWKVAYADFVTAMMAFFMVMWLTSQSEDVRKAVADHFRNPGGRRLTGSDARSMLPSSNSGNGNRRATKERGNRKSDGDSKVRKMTDEGNRTNVGTIVEFDLNSLSLSELGKENLRQLLPELEGKLHRIEIRGHAADSGGDAEQAAIDAWNISFRRAFAVQQFLAEQGIDRRRMVLSQAGNSQPRFTATDIDHAGDSRVEVFVLTETFEEPAATTQRLVATKSLDEKAKRMDDKDKAAAAAEAAAGKEAAPKKH